MNFLKSFFCLIIFSLSPEIMIHPWYNNRTVHGQYAWSVAYNISCYLNDYLQAYYPGILTGVTPLSYNQLSCYEKISTINQLYPTLVIIISCYETEHATASVHLYYPFYESNNTVPTYSNPLTFIPFQYGYRNSYTQTHTLIWNLYQSLQDTKSTLKLHPPHKLPLKIAIGLQAPTLFIDIGLPSPNNIDSILTTLTTACAGIFNRKMSV